MKAKKIYGMAKQSQNLLVLIDESRQFFNIGGDIYLIDGMPYMEDAEFLAYLDVPKHKRDEWDVVPKYMTRAHEAAVLCFGWTRTSCHRLRRQSGRFFCGTARPANPTLPSKKAYIWSHCCDTS